MTETIKEFINGTVDQTSLDSDDRSTISIITNDDSTTRVIRDMQVQESDIASLTAKMTIDDTVVMNSFEDATGTVVVPPDESFDVKLNVPVELPKTSISTYFLYSPVSDTDIRSTRVGAGKEEPFTTDSRFEHDWTGVTLSDYVTPIVSDTTENLADTITASNLSEGGQRNRIGIIEVPDEKVWYTFNVDDNADCKFGIQFLVGSNRYPAGNYIQLQSVNYGGGTFDYEKNRFFVKNGQYIEEYDLTYPNGINTGGVARTQHPGFYAGGSSYATGTYCNNHYFYFYLNTIYSRNLALATGYGQTNGTVADQRSFPRLIVLYNESEERFYYIAGGQQRDNFEMGYFDASNSQAGNYNTIQTVITTNMHNYMSNLSGGSDYNDQFWTAQQLGTNLVSIPYSDNATRVYTAESQTLVYTGHEITYNNAFQTGSGQYKSLIPLGSLSRTPYRELYSTSGYDISAKVRLSGVEIT